MSERRQATFIVKMWSESEGNAEPSWRGSIHRVETKRRYFFSNLGAMCEFMISERANVGALSPPDGPPDV